MNNLVRVIEESIIIVEGLTDSQTEVLKSYLSSAGATVDEEFAELFAREDKIMTTEDLQATMENLTGRVIHSSKGDDFFFDSVTLEKEVRDNPDGTVYECFVITNIVYASNGSNTSDTKEDDAQIVLVNDEPELDTENTFEFWSLPYDDDDTEIDTTMLDSIQSSDDSDSDFYSLFFDLEDEDHVEEPSIDMEKARDTASCWLNRMGAEKLTIYVEGVNVDDVEEFLDSMGFEVQGDNDDTDYATLDW